ncbi:MAG TPA: TIGR03619 family F420-dependent LLM class oxidoreductase [Mycobacteriales bacterium]|nr:TIGR03619 family F420-dependent LLM class oxidoreductase [Mycobacteriales bacterium]
MGGRQSTPAVTLSIGLPNFGGWAGGDWRALVDTAVAAEAAGAHRVIVTDHVVMGGDTSAYHWGRFPTAPDGPWLEPLTVLSAIASATSRVRLATGILIAGLRPVPVLAKTVATLDALSGGRVDLGVGVGWQQAEYDASGLDFATRGRRLDETIAGCRALWSQSPASYRSATISFDGVYCWPQPAQPRLPVWFAGTLNERNLRRIVDLGDGWIPIMGSTLDDVRAGAARLRQACDRAVGVQATLPIRRDSASNVDLAATVDQAPEWAAAGATDLYVNVAAIAGSPDAAPDALHELVTRFTKVTG